MDMRADRRTLLVLVTSIGLLATWLFFGCLALIDQMHLTPETSTQDEHALVQLASSLKPDVPNVEGRLGQWCCDCKRASTAHSLVFTDAVHPIDYTPVQDLPALRLHQRVSIYRI